MKPIQLPYDTFPHCSLPIHLVDAPTADRNAFYRTVFLNTLNSMEPGELTDDGWHGWTSTDGRQPLPDDAPDSLKAQLESGWIPSFDINWMLSDGDWGWNALDPILGGWDVKILAESVEWINPTANWEQQSAHKELCEAKARKLSDGTWEIEIISLNA